VSRSAGSSLLVVALLLLGVALWIPRVRGPIDLRWDAGTYYVLGTSLAEGRGYRLLNEPGEIEAIQYPPLLPTVVAVHQWMLGTSDPMIVGRWLRLTFFLTFMAYVVVAFVVLKRMLPPGYAFLAVVTCMIHLFTMFLAELLFAELPFALVSLLFVFWCGWAGSRERGVLAALCAVSAYLLRTAGLALLLAWVADSLFRREFKRAAARSAVALLPIVGWQAYIAGVEAGASYRAPFYPYQRAAYMFYNVSYAANLSLRDSYRPELGKVSVGDVVRRVAGNVKRMPAALGEAVSADRSHWQSLIDRWAGTGGTRWKVGSWGVMGSLAALGALTLGGLAIQLAGPERVVALYVLAYAGAVCLTPWPFQLRRYWSPLAPLLALALFQCVLALRGRGRFAGSFVVRIAARTLPVIVVVIVLTVQVFTLFYAYRVIRGNVVLHDRQGAPIRFSLFFYRQPDRDLDEVLEWLRVRARPGDVVAAAMPHWAHLVTGMKTVVPPFETDPERAQALLDSVPVRYIVMDPDGVRLMRESAAAVLDSHSARWRRVYTGASGLASVYERVCETASGAR
jgi:hypothetical protein